MKEPLKIQAYTPQNLPTLCPQFHFQILKMDMSREIDDTLLFLSSNKSNS